MNQNTESKQKMFPPSHLGDGLDDDELPLHPEMITPEEEEYKRGLQRVVEFNTH